MVAIMASVIRHLSMTVLGECDGRQLVADIAAVIDKSIPETLAGTQDDQRLMDL